MPSLSITIPAYNEEETLESVVREAAASAATLDTDDYEVLVVNDGSTDGTGAIADRLAAELSAVRVHHHERNRGFSGAMKSCFENAQNDFAFLGPADGQARYEDLSRFWEQVGDNDLIFSYRVGRGDRVHRKVASFLWFLGLRILFGYRVPEFSSLFLFRRSTVAELPVDVRPDASNFLPVLFITAKRRGVPVGLVGTVQHERLGGVAKGSDVRNTLRTLAEDLRLWWRLRVRKQL
jgi:glycosyltransferase involved in cell wall biosynthesis